MEVPDLDLYLSQLTVLSASEDSSSGGSTSTQLLTSQHLPHLLRDSSSAVLHEANVWINATAVSSSLHYDGNHNLLHLGTGRKEVVLAAPLLTALLAPSPVHSSTPNHSSLGREEMLTRLGQQHAFAANSNSNTAVRVTLQAGDCLFIPEGCLRPLPACY